MLTMKLYDANVTSLASAVSSVSGGGFDVATKIIENKDWSEIGLHESDQTIWADEVKVTHLALQNDLPRSSGLSKIAPRDKLATAILQAAAITIMEHLEEWLGVTALDLARACKYDPEDEMHPGLTEELLNEVCEDKAAFERCKKAIGNARIVYRISGFCSWLGQEIKYLEETSSVLDVYRSSLRNLGISLTVTPYGLYLKPRLEQTGEETENLINTSKEGDEK